MSQRSKPCDAVASVAGKAETARRARTSVAGASRPDAPGSLYRSACKALIAGDVAHGLELRRMALEAGLDTDHLCQLDIEAAFQSGDWDRLAAQVAPDRDFDLPAIASPWIRIAAGRMQTGDLVGAMLAMDRFVQLRPSDFSFLAELLMIVDPPAQDREVRYFLGAAISAGATALDMEAAQKGTKEGTQIHESFALYTRVAKRNEAAASGGVTKLARDWSRAVWQPAAAPADQKLTSNERDRLASTLQTALNGDFSTAAAELATMSTASRSPFITARLAETERLLAYIANAPIPSRPDLDNQLRDIAVSEASGSDRLAVVFTGLSERVSGLPISIFDRILALAGYRTIFLRDSSRSGFACGIRSVAPSARATVDHLRTLTSRRADEELLVIGTSGGGYAALRYGLELEADRIVVISGGTVCDPQDMARLGDSRAPLIARRAVERAGPDDFTAPVHSIIADYDKHPEITLHFSAGMEIDRAHAGLLAGYPGVTLAPCDGDTRHNIIAAVLDQLLMATKSIV